MHNKPSGAGVVLLDPVGLFGLAPACWYLRKLLLVTTVRGKSSASAGDAAVGRPLATSC